MSQFLYHSENNNQERLCQSRQQLHYSSGYFSCMWRSKTAIVDSFISSCLFIHSSHDISFHSFIYSFHSFISIRFISFHDTHPSIYSIHSFRSFVRSFISFHFISFDFVHSFIHLISLIHSFVASFIPAIVRFFHSNHAFILFSFSFHPRLLI